MHKMGKHGRCGALVLVIALWCAAPLPVHAAPFTAAVEYDGSSLGFDDILRTVGYEFSMSNPFTVNALAYWNDGQGNNHRVGIWDSGASLVVSTTVLGADFPQGHFLYHSITPITLGSGTYVIGGEYLGGTFPSFATGVVTVADYTWITDKTTPGAGLNYPTLTTNGGYGQNGILIPNFSIVPAAPVPEPSTVLLLASGLAGLLGYGWRRKKVE